MQNALRYWDSGAKGQFGGFCMSDANSHEASVVMYSMHDKSGSYTPIHWKTPGDEEGDVIPIMKDTTVDLH